MSNPRKESADESEISKPVNVGIIDIDSLKKDHDYQGYMDLWVNTPTSQTLARYKGDSYLSESDLLTGYRDRFEKKILAFVCVMAACDKVSFKGNNDEDITKVFKKQAEHYDYLNGTGAQNEEKLAAALLNTPLEKAKETTVTHYFLISSDYQKTTPYIDQDTHITVYAVPPQKCSVEEQRQVFAQAVSNDFVTERHLQIICRSLEKEKDRINHKLSKHPEEYKKRLTEINKYITKYNEQAGKIQYGAVYADLDRLKKDSQHTNKIVKVLFGTGKFAEALGFGSTGQDNIQKIIEQQQIAPFLDSKSPSKRR
jgi:hypothetical protein